VRAPAQLLRLLPAPRQPLAAHLPPVEQPACTGVGARVGGGMSAARCAA
jgi:hypothetical protein